MTLFRKKTADEMQSKILDTIQDYRESLNSKTTHQEKMKSSNFKATVGFLTMTGSTLGGLGGIMAVAGGIIAGPVGGAVLVGSLGIATAALAYAGVNAMVSTYHKARLDKMAGIDNEAISDNKFEQKMNKILSNTNDHSGLSFSQMANLKHAVKNDDGMSLDNALKSMNLPDTKHKTVFKENLSGQLEASLEKILPKSFYSTRKEVLKTGLGVTVAMGGAIAAVGGLTAASAMVTGLGVIASAGALAWSGIRMAAEAIENRQIKKQFSNKNDEDVGTRKTKLAV